MDLRLTRAELLIASREFLKARGIPVESDGALVVLNPDGSEITGEFLVEVRGITLMLQTPRSAAPAPRGRSAERRQEPEPSFPSTPDETGVEEEEENEEGESDENALDDAAAAGLDGADDDETSDFSDEKTLRELAAMMSADDKKSAKALDKHLKQGGSLTRSPTKSRAFTSLREAGKGPGDMNGEF